MGRGEEGDLTSGNNGQVIEDCEGDSKIQNMDRRGSGILLHITSLPSPFGIGDLGPRASKFADFLADTKQCYWQILPLNPTDLHHGNSPYHSRSIFAGNPLLISPDFLVRDGWLTQAELEPLPHFSGNRVDFVPVIAHKETLLDKAYKRFTGKDKPDAYHTFCEKNAHWLDDYALFLALKSRFEGKTWSDWAPDFRDRRAQALQEAGNELRDTIDRVCFYQYLVFEQWMALKNYCNSKGVRIIGDMPFYAVYDSADVWVHQELFNLDHEKRPLTVAGVPPDYFSETGQLWGNPVYKWDVMKERGYDWWVQRMAHNLELYDFVRVDHFRGFVGYWEIPVSEKNAVNGQWVQAPARDFFERITGQFPHLPIIAEDLGVITPDVVEVIRHFRFPGMKILLFAFGDDLPTNPYAPHNLERNSLVYTGTHDNNTAKGWFETETSPEIKDRLSRYVGREVSPDTVGRELTRLAMMSVADTAIIPLQDLLCLGEETRMNTPASRQGNWEWRFEPDLLTSVVANDLLDMTVIYGRG